MRKQYLISLIALAGMLMLSGCNKEPGIGADYAGQITIQATIGQMTKVAYNGNATSFSIGDSISLYGWTGSNTTVSGQRVVDGVSNIFDGSKWIPSTSMCWKNSTTSHYFLGIYPVQAGLTGFTDAPFILNPADYTSSDLLIATNLTGVKATDGPVNLTFDHVMAKLNVNLKFRNEVGVNPVVESVTATSKSTATVNYLTKKVTATGSSSAVVIPQLIDTVAGYDLSFSGLQVPQNGVRKIAITIGGKKYVYESTQDIPLKSGKITNLDLTVGKDIIELGTVSVSDWLSGKDLPGGEAVSGLATPLTFEAAVAGAQVIFSFSDMSYHPCGVKYRKEINGNWSDWESYYDGTPVTLTNVGDKVQFAGSNGLYDSDNFFCSEDCYVYGNIMSLITETGFEDNTVLTQDMAFHKLFKGNTHLKSHPTKLLYLPATKLTNNCYNDMFSGCTGLTIAPELPATTLTDGCYSGMFGDCISLIAAPDLPATTLTASCYAYMFEKCESLCVVPDTLPATKMAVSCYYSMFYGCSSLTYAPVLPALELAYNCYLGMFWGCVSLTSAPVLPATKLAGACYFRMFLGCSSLNSITCLATDVSAEDCTYEWVRDVPGGGTFITPSGTNWTTGIHGIPSGWTRVDYVTP